MQYISVSYIEFQFKRLEASSINRHVPVGSKFQDRTHNVMHLLKCLLSRMPADIYLIMVMELKGREILNLLISEY